MSIPENVILLDSLGDIQPGNTHSILVCASHCGDNGVFARKLKNCQVQAVFLNNAGVGKNQAGISGLVFYEAEGILACAVDHNSAEIGVARDTWENGIVSHVNKQAHVAGIRIGESVQSAVDKANKFLRFSVSSKKNVDDAFSVDEMQSITIDPIKQVQTEIKGRIVTVTNSITFLNESNAGDIVVCGSHGGVSAGHYAQKHCLKAVFFNDAGVGKNNAGIKSLASLSEVGIMACTVDCMSAEIFNAKDVLENGIVSVCNSIAREKGVRELMTVKEAIGLV